MSQPPQRFEVAREDQRTLKLRLGGEWHLQHGLPSVAPIERALDSVPEPRRLVFDASALAAWDSTLLAFVEQTLELARQRSLDVDVAPLPEGLRRLLALADVGGRSPSLEADRGAEAMPAPGRPSWLARVGLVLHRGFDVAHEVMAFVGEAVLSLGRFVRGRARYRPVDLLTEIEGAGADALVIVTVVSFLLGMILAFVGAVTLRPFGASIYVANVVAVATVRELGPIMTAIIMAGRTGSSYAAQLGTMQVTQEVDALSTMGLPPFDFLVLPRLLALALMMPLLGVYADFVALFGGGLIAIGMPDVNVRQYLLQTRDALELTTFWLGLIKASAFGALVAIAGCAHGMRAGKSAAAVGQATTRAVVSAIVGIIVVDGIFAVLFYLVGV